MATQATTEARIFNGALLAIARQGPKKLTMRSVAAESGVSGGTLYRYFRNKQDLLEALGDHFVMKLRGALQQAIAEEPDPAERLRVVTATMLRFWEDNPATLQLGQIEPGFVLAYIKSVRPRIAKVTGEVLEPVLGRSPAISQRVATVDEVVDLLVRMAFSHYFMPAHHSGDLCRLLVALGAAAGLEPRHAQAGVGHTAV